ncbi:MAG: sigma-70 family RNA polymerase sigma factor [Lachnospiraceae bacterium]|nr:sigma-70 family RNA polymerase sigma factor [Lachnospiraceae bacterium]
MQEFEELYKAYYPQVYLYLLDLCGDGDLAEELTQETFFKVLKKIDTFEGKSSIGTWMIQIAKNNFYNDCKKKKYVSTEECGEIPAKDNPERRAVDKDTAREIHLILHKLEEPYKEVFWMRTFGELSFKEIGAIHGKTEGWARVTFYRAKQRIKEELG